MDFESRVDAGQELAQALEDYRDEDAVVLALPRGGVVVGAEVARALAAPLGLILVKKLGHPRSAEYAIGAVAEDGDPVYGEEEVASIDKDWLNRAEAAAREAIEQRRELYFGEDFVPPEIQGRVALIVDDGMATGLTMLAAAQAVRNKGASKVVVGIPVASSESIELIESEADEIVVLDEPENFLGAVGAHYTRFEQVDDFDVKAILWDTSSGI